MIASDASSAAVLALDDAANLIGKERTEEGLFHLYSSLHTARRNATAEQWREIVSITPAHPVSAMAHACPLTLRSFQKPRGYAGDAVMLDHIYRRLDFASTAPDPASFGGRIYSYNLQRTAPRAVCFRASLLTKLIDQYAAADSKPIRIFSLACGHLREAESCLALRSGRIVEFLAVDQDAESIDHVARQFKTHPITVGQASVADLLKGRLKVSDFTFVYAAGLFDYLTDALAAKLMQKLFQSVKSGGKLLVANFKPGGVDDGYMEAIMDWWLIYRDEAALRKLCRAIPLELVASVSIFSDPTDSIAFTVLQKA